MITPKDRAAWAKRLKYRRFAETMLVGYALVMLGVAASKFWMVHKGWPVLTALERSRLEGEFNHPDWSSTRRGLELLVRDAFLAGVRNTVIAAFAVLGFFLQRYLFAYHSRLWSHITALESQSPGRDSEVV